MRRIAIPIALILVAACDRAPTEPEAGFAEDVPAGLQREPSPPNSPPQAPATGCLIAPAVVFDGDAQNGILAKRSCGSNKPILKG